MPVCLPTVLDGAGEALRILVNEASRIERSQHLQAMPDERSGGFYPIALERGSRAEQAMNLALAEMYVQGGLHPQSDHRSAKACGARNQHSLHID